MKKTFLFSGVVLVIILFICSIMIKWQPNYSMISLLLKIIWTALSKTEMNDGHIHSVSVLIIKDNKMLLNKGYGYANIKNKQK